MAIRHLKICLTARLLRQSMSLKKPTQAMATHRRQIRSSNMYLLACGVLVGLASVLNWRDRRMLALTFAVGINIFYFVPDHSQAAFYGTCIALEAMVLAVAVFYSPRACIIIVYASLGLIITHFMGWTLDGSAPLSPYGMIVKILEISQLFACVALSPVLTPILRNSSDATTT